MNSVNHDKIQSGMVTKIVTHLLTGTLQVLVIKSALLLLGRYLWPVTTQNRYKSIGSSGKFFSTTTARNVTIVRCRLSLVTIMVLDFVMNVSEFRESHLGKTQLKSGKSQCHGLRKSLIV